MAFLPLPADSRGRSMSAPSLVPPPGPGPKWLSPVLPTPPDSDDDAKAAPPRKRPARQFAVFELGFMPLMSTEEPPKVQLCYEELEEEPQLPPTPRVTLKDGRELRPLLKHRKRSASHNVPQSARWGAALTRTPSSVSISTPSNENLDDDKPASEHEPEPEHPHEHEHSHVHFSEALENVCVFDEAAPAHDADPTHSPLPDKPCLQPPPSPRTRTCRQLRLPSTVIASSRHKAALGFDSSEPNSPSIPSPAPLSARGDMRLTLACDAALPSPQNAPRHGMFTTLGMQISPSQNALTGVVRARNIAFEKRVWVLYSVDDWRTQREAEGTWTDAYREGKGDIPARPDGYDDFEISIPLMELGIQGSVGTAVRARILHFAIGYSVPDKGEWWDNRDGANWVARFRAVCPGSFA